jgi:arylsulfatase A-like enzyme
MLPKNLSLLTTGFLCISVFSCTTKTEQQNSEKENQRREFQKPNVIYILADDLGYGDLSCYGQEKFSTPNIDKLAREGIMFTQHYAGSTVCAPSRSVLMTGLHTGHTPSRGNRRVKPLGQFPLPDSSFTVAELFNKQGYVTGAYGKWGLGSVFNEGDPQKQGFRHYFGHYCQSYAHRYYPEFLWDDGEKILLNNNDSLRDYSADIIHSKALEFIQTYKDSSFFLFLPYTIPHAELILPEDEVFESNRGKYLPEKNFIGNDYFTEDYNPYGYASQDEGHAAFVSMVLRLDRYVGEILDELEKAGITGNTMIMFTSDNGPHQEGGADPDYFISNGGLKGIKRDLYEGGIRVPFLVSWPAEIRAGTESDHISVFYDFLPTMADLLDDDENIKTDGISFLPTLLNEEDQPEHEFLYWEFHERGGKQAVRMGKWKAIRLDIQENPDAQIELYDLEMDPSEGINIADEYPELVQKCKQIMESEHIPSKDFPFLFESQED